MRAWSRRLGWRRMVFGVVAVAPILVLGVILWQNRAPLVRVLQHANYSYFLGTFLTYSLSILVVAWGWHLILRCLTDRSGLGQDIRFYVYTLAARRIPGTLWYIAGRAILYERAGLSKQLISVASGVEVVVSIVAGLLVGSGSLVGWGDQSPWLWLLFVIVLVIGGSALHPRILAGLLARLGHPLPAGPIPLWRVGSWLLAYGAMWLTGGLMACTILAALHPLPLTEYPRIISLWSISGVIAFLTFLLPNTLGLSELTLSLLFSRVVPLEIAVTTALLVRVLTTLFDVGWSSLYFLRRSEPVGSGGAPAG